MNYYNENDPNAADWLENLMFAGLIPWGRVDRRSIRDVEPGDLAGFTQCHFFAGIGGWSRALELAGWPVDRPIWTGSCPCQPFSAAGLRKGEADERHLWPEFARLIRECRPAIVAGEQVASPDGRQWLAGVFVDLERMAYAAAGADLCAAGVGAPHMRQRLYWIGQRLGNPDDDGREARRCAEPPVGFGHPVDARGRERGFGLAYADGRGLNRRQGHAFDDGETRGRPKSQRELERGYYDLGDGLAHADDARLARPTSAESAASEVRRASAQRNGFWGDAEWLNGNDGKARRVKPGVPLLVDGVPSRVATSLAGYGNAIVPQLAAEFIRAAT